jgi:hypothetical protein
MSVILEERKARGLMQVIEKIMEISQNIQAPLPPPLASSVAQPLNEMAKLYELAKRIHHAGDETTLQETLRKL